MVDIHKRRDGSLNEKIEKMIAKFSLTVAGSREEENPENSWESILGELINPPSMEK